MRAEGLPTHREGRRVHRAPLVRDRCGTQQRACHLQVLPRPRQPERCRERCQPVQVQVAWAGSGGRHGRLPVQQQARRDHLLRSAEVPLRSDGAWQGGERVSPPGAGAGQLRLLQEG